MSVEFEIIKGQQQPSLNNQAHNELLITTIISLLEILDAGMDAQSKMSLEII